jgi:hypothetical protein
MEQGDPISKGSLGEHRLIRDHLGKGARHEGRIPRIV